MTEDFIQGKLFEHAQRIKELNKEIKILKSKPKKKKEVIIEYQ